MVDDSAASRGGLTETLCAWGATVESAASCGEAVERIVMSGAGERPYRVALIDSTLPDLDGFETARVIQALPRSQELRLILLSPVGQMPGPGRWQEVGFAGLLTKPVRQSELRQTLAVALAPHELRDGTPVATPAPSVPSPPDSLRVLVVEDNAVSRTVVTRLLEHEGHIVVQAGHGKDALATLAIDASFDLILMDLQMPVMDGFETTRRIRANRTLRSLAVVAMTAYARKGDREQCMAHGMDDYLAKPIRAASLRQLVARWSGPRPRRVQAPPAAEPARADTRPEIAVRRPPDAAAQGEAALDIGAVRRSLGGPGGLLAEVAALLLGDVPVQLAQLARAAQLDDAATVAKGAHRLCGAVSNLEAEDMMDLCRRLERLAGSPEAPRTAMIQHVVALRNAWASLEPLVREVSG